MIQPMSHEEVQRMFDEKRAAMSERDRIGVALMFQEDETWWLVAHGQTEGLSRSEIRWAEREGARGYPA